MLIAAGILTWMIFWMGKQARFLKSELEEGINKAAATTGKRAIFWLAFIAVVREGVELALFITAAFFAGNQAQVASVSNVVQTLAGTILGIGTAALLSWTLFATTVRLDLRKFFQVTGFLRCSRRARIQRSWMDSCHRRTRLGCERFRQRRLAPRSIAPDVIWLQRQSISHRNVRLL